MCLNWGDDNFQILYFKIYFTGWRMKKRKMVKRRKTESIMVRCLSVWGNSICFSVVVPPDQVHPDSIPHDELHPSTEPIWSESGLD